jgi:oxygen-independent coproporphyrinogen-3 oxidase
MPIFTELPPLSLYIHIPWCVRKCPYCDFNSHESKGSLPEELYVNALLQELDSHLPLIQQRPLISIFFGGGTPSLFSAQAIERILTGVDARLTFAPHLEITLEANPGTIDQVRFRDFKQAGINRLSLGIQSLQNDKLATLGRIHDRDNALRAIALAKDAGFTNFNLDLMYGLPNQSIDDALQDIDTALACEPTHFSWYQLTIEPNTLFHHQPPTLPVDDMIWDMQLAGQQRIQQLQFAQYEVSAYARPHKQCMHNLNYWEFGDYLGIGAGAHSKITNAKTGQVVRFAQVKHPRDYLDAALRQSININPVSEEDLIFEFMLNALRLTNGVPIALFTQRTGIPFQRIESTLIAAKQRDLLTNDTARICPSTLGKKFLNDLISLFLTAQK